MVSAVTFREPALVKAVTTLDARSGGRAWPGIGAGYQHEEAAALGLAMPPAAERPNDSAKRCASRWPCGPATSGPSRAWSLARTSPALAAVVGTDAGQVGCLRARCG